MSFAAMAAFRERDEQATREVAQREIERIKAGQAPITGPAGMAALVSTLERMNTPRQQTEILRTTYVPAAVGVDVGEDAAHPAGSSTTVGIAILVGGVLVLVVAGLLLLRRR